MTISLRDITPPWVLATFGEKYCVIVNAERSKARSMDVMGSVNWTKHPQSMRRNRVSQSNEIGVSQWSEILHKLINLRNEPEKRGNSVLENVSRTYQFRFNSDYPAWEMRFRFEQMEIHCYVNEGWDFQRSIQTDDVRSAYFRLLPAVKNRRLLNAFFRRQSK